MQASPKRIVLTAIVVDLLDIAFNLIATIITGSVVMLAETLQGFSDLVSDSFALIGLTRSKKRADSQHQFGYGKETYFWAILASLMMIAVTAGLSIYFGWQRLLQPTGLSHLWIALLITISSLITNSYSLSLSTRRLFSDLKSKRLDHCWQAFVESPQVVVKSTFVLDFVGFLAAVIGLVTVVLLSTTGNNIFDGLGAIGVGLLLIFLGLTLLMGLKGFVIGRSVSEETRGQIIAITESIPGVIKVLDLKTMHLGSEKILVNLEIHAKNNLTTDQLEVIIDKIKTKLIANLPKISHVQVELETPNP